MAPDPARGSRRRFLLAGLAGLLAAPLSRGEGEASAARVGLLGPDEEPRFSELAAGLRQGLRAQGYRDEEFLVIERRVPRQDRAGAAAAVQALVEQRAAVLLVIGSALVRAVRESAPEMPVVFVTPGDPVAAGLVASLARPGGHTTAMTFEYPELAGKRLELLRELSPRIRRILALYDPRDVSPRQAVAAARTAAGSLGLTLVERPVRTREEIDRALQQLDDVDALLGIPGGVTSGHYERMIVAANARRLATIFHVRGHSTRDALLTYGASDVDVARQAARLLDRILRGARAGELPVERPTTLPFVVNLGIARALNLTIPPALLLRADRVIE